MAAQKKVKRGMNKLNENSLAKEPKQGEQRNAIEDEYLEEDRGFLAQIESNRSNAFEGRERAKQELAILQIKATLRNRKSLHDFDKSTMRLSIILGAVAVLQLIVGLYQLLFMAQESDSPQNKVLGYSMIVAVMFCIWIV